MSDDEAKDLRLYGAQCHFVWNLDELMEFDSAEGALTFLEGLRADYNSLIRKTLSVNLKRARKNLMLAYLMSKWQCDGWDKAFDNALRSLKFALSQSPLKPQYSLPEFSSSLWKGSSLEFFSYVPEEPVASNDLRTQYEEALDMDAKEYSVEEKKAMCSAIEHVAFALKAEILKRCGASDVEVGKTLENIVPTERMSDQEQAALLFVKAATLRHCGPVGLPRAINVLRRVILIDPDNLKWTLRLVRYRGYQQRYNWGVAVEWSDIEDMFEAIDAILRLEFQKPKLRQKFQFEKLQMLQEYLISNRNSIAQPRKSRLSSTCHELCELLLETSDSPNMIAYCAKILSYNKSSIQRAIHYIEKSLQQMPGNIYINGKASTIYRRAGDFEKALLCAEVGAQRAVGSSNQVFELKLILDHHFDIEEFFEEAQKLYHGQKKEVQKLLRSAFLYYLCHTDDHSRSIAHFEAAFELDPSAQCLGESYCVFINRPIHAIEAAYCLVLMVQRKLSEAAATQEYSEVQKAIEAAYDVRTFRRLRRTTPEGFVAECRSDGAKWLKCQRERWTGRMRPNSPPKPEVDRDPRPHQNWRTEPREAPWTGYSATSEVPPASHGSWRNSRANASPAFSHWISSSSRKGSTSTNPNLNNWANRGSASDHV